MTNLKGATRHKACYGQFGIHSEECLRCSDTRSCKRKSNRRLIRCNKPKSDGKPYAGSLDPYIDDFDDFIERISKD